MKYIVTGGAGFIGSHLVKQLLRAGHHVLNIDKLTYAGNIASLEEVLHSPRYLFSQSDIIDKDTLRSLFTSFQPEGIFHLAAESHVDRSIDAPSDFMNTNIIGTFSLLEATRGFYQQLPPSAREQFRFIHVSTDEVYGALGTTGKFSESSAYSPHSPYSASKAASDHLVRAWHSTYGLPTLVTNCSNNYGSHQFPEKLIPLVILKALHKKPIPVYGKGQQIRDWLHVEDHCSALQTVMNHGQCGQTYTIGGNSESTNLALIQLLCSLLDDIHPHSQGISYQTLITFVSDRPGHDFRYAIDSTKIQKELSWAPQHTLVSGLKNTIHWYINHIEWWQEILNNTYSLKRLGTSILHA